MAKQVKKLKNLSLIALAVVITLAPAISVIGEEIITLTTIMPGQDTLRVKRGAVGVNYKDSTNYPDATIGNNNLIIEGAVGIGTANPAGKLDVASTNSGFIRPRFATHNDIVNNITTPAEGMSAYNLEDHIMEYYNGTNWVPMGGEPPIMQSRQVSTTTVMSTSSISYSDMSEMTINMTTRGGDLLVMFNTMVSSSNGGETIVRLLIDGRETSINGSGHTTQGKGSDSISLNWLEKPLDAGSHTIRIQWKVTDQTSYTRTYVNQEPVSTTLIVFELSG